MSPDALDELQRLTAHWNRSPISLAEITARRAPELGEPVARPVLAPDASVPEPFDLDAVRSRRSPRGARFAVAAVSFAVLVAGVVAVSQRRTEPAPDPLTPVAPATTGVPLDVDTIVPPSLEPDPTTPATSTRKLVDEQRQALSRFDSVAFTATIRDEQDDAAGVGPQTLRVVLRSDGSMHVTAADDPGGADGLSSYDATTGTLRIAAEPTNGSVTYQEYAGWQGDASFFLGIDPTEAIALLPGNPVRSEVRDGRPVWIVEHRLEAQSSRWTVDRETGLVVAYWVEWVADGITGTLGRRQVEITDIELDAPMPESFPFEFPADADVQRIGDPDDFRPMTLDAAADAFGAGFVVPAGLDPDALVAVTSRTGPTAVDDPSPDAPGSATIDVQVRTVGVTFTLRTGFVATTIALDKIELAPDATGPAGWPDTNEDCLSIPPMCVEVSADLPRLAAGAWEGAAYELGPDQLWGSRNGVRLGIVGAAREDAIRIAQSLVAPG